VCKIRHVPFFMTKASDRQNTVYDLEVKLNNKNKERKNRHVWSGNTCGSDGGDLGLYLGLGNVESESPFFFSNRYIYIQYIVSLRVEANSIRKEENRLRIFAVSVSFLFVCKSFSPLSPHLFILLIKFCVLSLLSQTLWQISDFIYEKTNPFVLLGFFDFVWLQGIKE